MRRLITKVIFLLNEGYWSENYLSEKSRTKKEKKTDFENQLWNAPPALKGAETAKRFVLHFGLSTTHALVAWEERK